MKTFPDPSMAMVEDKFADVTVDGMFAGEFCLHSILQIS
jgi:hypothetical protein